MKGLRGRAAASVRNHLLQSQVAVALASVSRNAKIFDQWGLFYARVTFDVGGRFDSTLHMYDINTAQKSTLGNGKCL